jgi:hypothetical protein
MRLNPALAIVGGLVGTPIMTVLTYVLAPMLGVNVDLVRLLAQTFGGWNTGMLLHILNGAVIFPIIFVPLCRSLLPGPVWLKGIAFGSLLWLASQLIAMPLMRAGIFSTHVGGARAAALLLIGHLVYGVSLGFFAALGTQDAVAQKSGPAAPWPTNPRPRSL